MAGGLPEPILISELVHLDHITIAGQTVEFRHVFYTWMAMLILFVVGWLVRRNISLIPGKMQNIFESIIGGLEDFTVTNSSLWTMNKKRRGRKMRTSKADR